MEHGLQAHGQGIQERDDTPRWIPGYLSGSTEILDAGTQPALGGVSEDAKRGDERVGLGRRWGLFLPVLAERCSRWLIPPPPHLSLPSPGAAPAQEGRGPSGWTSRVWELRPWPVASLWENWGAHLPGAHLRMDKL